MPAHALLPSLLDPRRRPDAAADLAALKADLARLGVNGRGWRLYAEFGDALFAPLAATLVSENRPLTAARNALAYLRLLQACEMDVPPPPALPASLAGWGLPGNTPEAMSPLFFRAAWKATMAAIYDGNEADGFVRAVVVPLARWFFASGLHATADPRLLKAGWPALCRRRQESLPAQPRPAQGGADEWDPYVRRVEYGGYVFTALTSEAQLVEEGKLMRHCVGSFGDDCRAGLVRIYSVHERKTGARVATFSLDIDEASDVVPTWGYGQISGPGNGDVSPRVEEAADAVLRAYNDLPHSAFSGVAGT